MRLNPLGGQLERLARTLTDRFGVTVVCRGELAYTDGRRTVLPSLPDQRLVDNTVRRRCGLARQCLRRAVRRKLIEDNPFEGLPAAVRGNADKFVFVTRTMVDKVMAACPDGQWRLIFALCRYGGLRCPSEVLALRWGDIDWANSRIRVTSPRTEHHGKGHRIIPLFPEIRPYLLAEFEAATPGDEQVITRYREATQNLRTTFEKIILRAGLDPWPKLFVNLRSTRATELAESFPSHVCSAWLGHTVVVAQRHYLQTHDEHFARALQNALQQPAATTRKGPRHPRATPPQSPENRALRPDASVCRLYTWVNIVVAGLEQTHDSLANSLIPTPSGAESGAVAAEEPLLRPEPVITDPAVAEVIVAWPTLPEPVKAGIVAMIRATGANGMTRATATRQRVAIAVLRAF